MIILKSCGSQSWGGLEIYTLTTASELQMLGHDVKVLCLPDSTLCTNTVKRGIQSLPLLSKGPARLFAILKLSRWLKKNPVDVLHTHYSNDLWVIVPALKLSGRKTKLILTKCMESSVSKKDIFHRFLYKRLHKIVAVSGFIKKNVLKTCPVSDEQVVVIPDSIQLERFNPRNYESKSIKTELGISTDVFVIGMIGRMTPGKGYEILLEAAEQIMNSPLRNKIRFLIVGAASHGEEEYEKKLLKSASEKNIESIIQFCGFRNDIPRYLAAMDILVFPSKEESFGGTLLEAMAMRVPVIASGSGGVPDIVIDGHTGLLMEKNNPEMLMAAIRKMYSNKELRDKFAENGRKRVEEHFEIRENMKLFEKLYGGKI